MASHTRGTHGQTNDHGNVIKKSSRTLPSKTRIKGYVLRRDGRAPTPRKLNAWDAGAVSAHVTCKNGARDRFHAAQKVDSVKGREGGLETEQYSFPPDPIPGARKGPRARHTGSASPPAPAGEHGSVTPSPARCARREPRHQSTKQATLTSTHCTAAPTCQAPNPQDTARYGTQEAGKHKHKHCTTKPEGHPEAPMGSTGMHRGGPKGPCHRWGCTYYRHKRS